MTSPTKVRRRPPWTWTCTDPDYVWHSKIDDCGYYETQAEAVAAADRHARLWHNPDHPIRVCGSLTAVGRASHGSCVLPSTFEHVHHETSETWGDDGEHLLLGRDFDENGRYLT